MSEHINRRDFIKRAGLAGATASVMASGVAARPVSPSDKVVVGVLGTGLMGRGNMTNFLSHPDVEIAAICDVYEPNLAKGVQITGGKAKTYKDFREILDRKDIDAVVVAAPDHWHALQMVLACQAGKDVYEEKPIATSMEEGKVMVEAARKYNRVVQVNTWYRSSIHFQKGVQLIQDGLIGKVSVVRLWNYLNFYPDGIGTYQDSDPPTDLDWDMWLGPAAKVPFNWSRFGVKFPWSTFRYFWDYAGGWMTDWGVHLFNVVQWAMKVDGPNAVTASGGKWYLQDNSETPDTLQATFEYPGFLTTYELRLCNQNTKSPDSADLLRDWGIEFHGTEGTLVFDKDGLRVIPEKRQRDKKQVDRTATVQMGVVNNALADHIRNFLDCVKSRQRPVTDIEIGHRATTTCQLGNIAYRTQERIVWDPAKQQLVQAGPEALKLLGREYRAPWKLTV
jgi:predicted dehydrogenase